MTSLDITSSKYQVAITMPLYNEASTISTYLTSINFEFIRIGVKPLFIVADDCSTDNSLKVLNDLSLKLPIKILDGVVNEGSGPATIRALNIALQLKIDFIINCDSDGQFDPKDIVNLFNKLSVQKSPRITVQALRTGRTEEWYRKIGTLGANVLASLKARERVRDSNCPLRGFSKDALTLMLPEVSQRQITPSMAFSVLSTKHPIDNYFINVVWKPRIGQTTQGTLWTSKSKFGSMRRYLKFCFRAAIQWMRW